MVTSFLRNIFGSPISKPSIERARKFVNTDDIEKF